MNKRSKRRRSIRGGGVLVGKRSATDVRSPEHVQDDGYGSTQIVRKLDDGLAPVLNDPEKRDRVVRRVVEVMELEDYRGPLPHPEHFAKYETASPGAGAKIIKMVDSTRNRADDRYDKIVTNDHQYRVLGMWMGGGIVVVCIVAGTTLCLFGEAVVGGALIAGSCLTAVASKFIDGKASE